MNDFERTLRSVVVAATFVATGCGAGFDDPNAGVANESVHETEQRLVDPTGKITTIIRPGVPVGESTGTHEITAIAASLIPSDFVMVGGGGRVQFRPQPGVLLQATKPNGTDSWTVRAKDHIVVQDSWTFQAAVVGLKLAGISAAALRSMIKVESGVAGIPAAMSSINVMASPDGSVPRVVIGGGAECLSPLGFQLLVASQPSPPGTGSTPTGWTASCKDHGVSDPGTAKAWVISLPACPPGLGACLKSTVTASSGSPAGGGYQFDSFNATAAVLGFGGSANFNLGDPGRLLTAIWPQEGGAIDPPNISNIFVDSKDHVFPSNGTASIYELTLSIQ